MLVLTSTCVHPTVQHKAIDNAAADASAVQRSILVAGAVAALVVHCLSRVKQLVCDCCLRWWS
jgi:hypothetical protein